MNFDFTPNTAFDNASLPRCQLSGGSFSVTRSSHSQAWAAQAPRDLQTSYRDLDAEHVSRSEGPSRLVQELAKLRANAAAAREEEEEDEDLRRPRLGVGASKSIARRRASIEQAGMFVTPRRASVTLLQRPDASALAGPSPPTSTGALSPAPSLQCSGVNALGAATSEADNAQQASPQQQRLQQQQQQQQQQQHHSPSSRRLSFLDPPPTPSSPDSVPSPGSQVPSPTPPSTAPPSPHSVASLRLGSSPNLLALSSRSPGPSSCGGTPRSLLHSCTTRSVNATPTRRPQSQGHNVFDTEEAVAIGALAASLGLGPQAAAKSAALLATDGGGGGLAADWGLGAVPAAPRSVPQGPGGGGSAAAVAARSRHSLEFSPSRPGTCAGAAAAAARSLCYRELPARLAETAADSAAATAQLARQLLGPGQGPATTLAPRTGSHSSQQQRVSFDYGGTAKESLGGSPLRGAARRPSAVIGSTGQSLIKLAQELDANYGMAPDGSIVANMTINQVVHQNTKFHVTMPSDASDPSAGTTPSPPAAAADGARPKSAAPPRRPLREAAEAEALRHEHAAAKTGVVDKISSKMTQLFGWGKGA